MADKKVRPSRFSWVGIVKLLLAIAILGFLAARVDRQTIDYLINQPKRFDLLGIALFWIVLAHLITYLRWWQLVRSLGVNLPLLVAIRIGFLGTAFNLVSLGAIGGDLFKAVVAARSEPSKMPEIVASVLVDRIFGLIGLVLVTCASFEAYVQLGDLTAITSELQWIRRIFWAVAIASLIGLTLLVCYGKYLPAHWLERLPIVGKSASRMAAAAHLLHGRPMLIATQIGVSFAVHIGLTLGFDMVSRALYEDSPSLLTHLIAIPPAFAVAALPITPGGVGVFEAAVSQFVNAFVPASPIYDSMLVIILAVYRLLLLGTAAIGGIYYLFGFGHLAPDDEKIVADYAQG